jgi:hypothetical protein
VELDESRYHAAFALQVRGFGIDDGASIGRLTGWGQLISIPKSIPIGICLVGIRFRPAIGWQLSPGSVEVVE